VVRSPPLGTLHLALPWVENETNGEVVPASVGGFEPLSLRRLLAVPGVGGVGSGWIVLGGELAVPCTRNPL
jgi:hypothetical protein